MSRTFKIALILLAVASIVSAALAVTAFIGKEREYMKRLVVEDKLANTLKEKRGLEKDLNAAKLAKEELEARLTKMQEKTSELSNLIEEEKKKREVAIADLDVNKEEIARLKLDLEAEKKEKLSISKKLEDIKSEYEQAKKDVARIKNEKASLEAKIADLEQKAVNLDKIVVSYSENINSGNAAIASASLAKSSSPRPIEGKTLVVNKEYSFIVTDIGQDKGVQKGMIFEVKEGKEYLGNVEIDKVYDTMSSATVLTGARINDMKKGNLIIESR